MILKWLMAIFWNFLELPWLIYCYVYDGEASFGNIQNKMILTVSIKFIVDSDRFTGSIF